MKSTMFKGIAVRLARAEDVPLGQGRRIDVGERSLALFRTDRGFFAMENKCPHAGGPLADGIVAGDRVYCPLHNRSFELSGGKSCAADGEGVETLPTQVKGGSVYAIVPLEFFLSHK